MTKQRIDIEWGTVTREYSPCGHVVTWNVAYLHPFESIEVVGDPDDTPCPECLRLELLESAVPPSETGKE